MERHRWLLIGSGMVWLSGRQHVKGAETAQGLAGTFKVDIHLKR